MELFRELLPSKPMNREACTEDALGNKFGREYSLILTDPTFERRLKMFDPNLKLMFDQQSRRWVILEWVPGNTRWNVLLKAQDDQGNPKPLGEWVFNTLFVWRHRAEERDRDFDGWWSSLLEEQRVQQRIIDEKDSADHKARLLDERNEWRKANRELKNEPVSDVTAGYPKGA